METGVIRVNIALCTVCKGVIGTENAVFGADKVLEIWRRGLYGVLNTEFAVFDEGAKV